MMAVHDFPRCAAYLKASNYILNDPSMSDKAWAVCVSEAFTDEELVADGQVSFETMSGDAILGEFERLLMTRRRVGDGFQEIESLKAFIGSRGVKVSAFESEEDYWTCARILWPQAVASKDGGPLALLHHKIKSLSKKQRRSASANLARIPAKWRAA
jgi:hypothetical protein